MIFQLLMVRGKNRAHQNGHKAQFCLKSYNQEIEYIIPSLYHGEYINFNIISFVDKSVKSSLIFNEESLITKQMSINQVTKRNEPIIIKFEIPYEKVSEEESNKISNSSCKMNFFMVKFDYY